MVEANYDDAISIHALREEGDVLSSALGKYPRQFLSTPSARRATSPGSITTAGESNFYPRPPRGGRHPKLVPNKRIKSISIHALREEGDPELQCCCTNRRIFLSTPSARRATAKTETKSLFSYKLYNILHEFRRALIYNGSKNYPNHAK